MITKEGDFNVIKKNMRGLEGLDSYHELISMSWLTFTLLISGVFFCINLVFALLYFAVGPAGIAGLNVSGDFDFFLQAFYFSTQTITTVGFGSLSPNNDMVSILAAIESFLGLLGFALATGLMFARFSRPLKNLAFSESAIVSPYGNEQNGLMFRFINSSKNQLIEAEVEMAISYWSASTKKRIFKSVELERSKINFFSSNWTVVHPIDEKSPLWGLTKAEAADKYFEVIVMFKAFDDTYVRQVYDRISYVSEEIKWGEKFVSIYEESADDRIHVNMDLLSETEKVELN